MPRPLRRAKLFAVMREVVVKNSRAAEDSEREKRADAEIEAI